MYWCLRAVGASGHPPRSSFFADRLIRQSDVESLFRMLQRVAVLYQHKYGEQELDANREFWKLSGFESDSNGQTWEQHQHRLTAVFSELEKQADDKLEVPNSLRLILCLDEASELLNVNGRQEGQFFRSVRHAAGEAGITLVLADTNSRITNFISPHASHAASSDRWQKQLGTVPAPWIAFNVLDFEDFRTERLSVGSPMSHELDAEKVLLLGRPLWLLTFQQAKRDVRELREFAIRKLLCTTATPNSGERLTQEQAVAIVASRCVLPNVGSFDYSSAVASHMATCVGISHSREQVFAQYFSEPILAEAAAFVMHEYDHHRSMIFDPLAHLWTRAATANSAGQRGEVTVQLLACMAKDRVVVSSAPNHHRLFTSEVSALEFLKTFCELKEQGIIIVATAVVLLECASNGRVTDRLFLFPYYLQEDHPPRVMHQERCFSAVLLSSKQRKCRSLTLLRSWRRLGPVPRRSSDCTCEQRHSC